MSHETDTLTKTSFKVLGKVAKYGTILLIIGSIMLAYSVAQIDFRINYSDLGSRSDLVVQPFYASKDNQRIQFAVMSYSLDTNHIGLVHYNDQVLKVVLEYSTSSDFTQSKVIYSQTSDGVDYGFYGQIGWYRIIVTNLSDIKVGVAFTHAESTFGNYIFTGISGALFGIGAALLAISFSLTLTFAILLVLFYPLFKLIEVSFSRREYERQRIYYPNQQQNKF